MGKRTGSCHVLRSAHRLEANKRNLHREDGADDVERAVGHVDSKREPPEDEQDENVQRNQVDDEDVAAPRGHHVKVRQGGPRGPEDGAGLDGLDPQVVSEHEREDGDPFVVVRACDGAADVTGNDADESSGEQAGTRGP